MSSDISIHELTEQDHEYYYKMLDLFGAVFEDEQSYCSTQPNLDYVKELLNSRQFFSFVALDQAEVVGAVAGYELPKFEQARSELYIYDIGVAEEYRRRGIASALIRATQELAKSRGAWVVFVQADHEDEPAVALYTKLGTGGDVLHFDLPVPSGSPSS